MPLPLSTKIIYGTGDWSLSSFNTFRQIFYAIFLTEVVGLDPRIASLAAFTGFIWDAINDPLMGTLSDRVTTRWGRRRPFLLFGAVPFGLAFLALWWAPPWQSEWALAIHVTLAYVVADTLQTIVSVPFYALTPELTPDYDERTNLTTWRMLFNLLATLAVAVAAPEIVDWALAHGHTPQQGYLMVASLFGFLGVLPFLAIAAVVRERPDPPQHDLSIVDTLRGAWRNRPFRYLIGLYMLNWITFDLVASMIPFFVLWRVAGGDPLAKFDLFGTPLAMESAMLGMLLVVAILALPAWAWVSARVGKRGTYLVSMALFAAGLTALFFVQPGSLDTSVWLAAFLGLGASAAHVIPYAMIPDVVDVDELETMTRNEGIYYGASNLIRKAASAFVLAFALQVIGWTGYVPASELTEAGQPASALLAIRILTGPAGAALIVGAMIVAWFYPLTRTRHAEVRAALEARRAG